MKKVLDAIFSQAWALYPDTLEKMIAIASREHHFDQEALSSKRDQYLAHTQGAMVRDDVAIIQVHGPIFARADFFMDISGATTAENIMNDFTVAMENPKIRSIILAIDSPGGEVSGISELAEAIYMARGKKKVVAHVQGMGASAAFWLAAAAQEIVVADTALAGSIGVVWAFLDKSAQSEKAGVRTVEFVSSVSKNKRPDLNTDEGKAQIQRLVDDMGDVFVNTVARYRAVTREKVLSHFGQGDMFVGAKAVEQGLADKVGSFEMVMASLSERPSQQGGIKMSGQDIAPVTTVQPVVDHAAAQEAAVKAERERIQAIESIKAPGYEALIAKHKYDPKMTKASVSSLILDAQAEEREKQTTARTKDAKVVAEKVQRTEAPEGDLDNAEDDSITKAMASGFNERMAQKRPVVKQSDK